MLSDLRAHTGREKNNEFGLFLDAMSFSGSSIGNKSLVPPAEGIILNEEELDLFLCPSAL